MVNGHQVPYYMKYDETRSEFSRRKYQKTHRKNPRSFRSTRKSIKRFLGF